jgi:hypothetical protein
VNPQSEAPLFYYCNDGATVEGPYYWEQILELYEAGSVSTETSLCVAGHEEWTTLGSYFSPGEEAFPEEQTAAETPQAATLILDTPIVASRPSFVAPAEPAAPSRRKKWMALAAAPLLLALLGYSGAGLFKSRETSGQSAAANAETAESAAESWTWAVQPRYENALPFASMGLAAVRLTGKWGLIDRTGKEVIPCAYDEIEIFPKEKCAAVREGSVWGLVDEQGKLVLKPEWEEVQPLVNGFIPVKKDGKWGYAEASGKLVIPCTWDNAWRFSAAGTAVVTKETGEGRKRGYIDKSGRVITAPEWDGAQTPSAEGLGAVRRGNVWALVDKSGKVLGEPQWEMQWRLLRPDLGFLPVCKGGKWGLIALDGTVLIEPAWDWVAPAEKGVLLSRPGTQSIFVGAGGKTIFESGPWDEVRGLQSPSDYEEKAPGFTEGLLAVRSADKWGFIDDKGKTVIPATWDNVGAFSEGLVAVSNKNEGDGWKFLTADGSPAFANPDGIKIGDPWNQPRFRNGKVKARGPRFATVAVDREGKIVGKWNDNLWLPDDVTIEGTYFDYVSRYGRYGYMRNFADKDGQIFMRDVPYPMSTLDDPFPYPGPPRYGLASASGKVLVEPTWDCAEVISPDWVRIWVGGREGLVNAKGEQILGPEWERVEVAGNGLLLATDGDRKLVFDRAGKALLPADLEGAEYVDFYAGGFVVRSKNTDGSTLWSLCDPGQPKPVSFTNAARVYWSGGMAENGLLWIEERDSGRWSLIKRDGTPLGLSQMVQPSKWHMTEGFGLLSKDDGMMVHVDAAGKELGNKTWEKASFFRHGLAAVATGGKSGFLGTNGELVVPAEWDEVGDFENIGSEEAPVLLARVAREGRWGCIDRSGSVVVEPQWDEMSAFARAGDRRALASVRRGNLWGIIDQGGAVVIEPCAERAGNMQGGVVTLTVKKEGEQYGRYVHYDTNGAEIDWQAVETKRKNKKDPLSEGMELYKSREEKLGLKDAAGKFVVAPKWDYIAWIGPQLAAAWNESEGGIFDETGTALFRDDAKRRLARFNRPDERLTPRRYQQGLVLIEATPVWGYAKLANANP